MDHLTKTIAAHPYRINAHRVWCACGWEAYPSEVSNGMDAHAAHVAAAIRADRTITTVEQLDALPDGSVVLDADGDTMEADTACDRRIWYVPGREWEWVGNGYTHLPARVLYRPDEDGE